MISQSPPWPTSEDVAHFEEYGWVTSPQLIPEELLDEAVEATEAYYLGERDHQLPIQGGFLDWRPEHGEGLRLNDYVSLQSETFLKLISWPDIGRAAAALIGAEKVRLFHDQLITKPPVSSGINTTIGWHTDKSYWQTCSSKRMLTAWIPLQDSPEDSGPLAVVDGSHKWEGTDWMTTFVLQDFAAIESQLGRAINACPIALRRGQISFHHARTIHGSYPNRGDQFRTALTVHLQDDENRYQRVMDGNGRLKVHVNDVLCRKNAIGEPDYSDPSICPTLWPI